MQNVEQKIWNYAVMKKSVECWHDLARNFKLCSVAFVFLMMCRIHCLFTGSLSAQNSEKYVLPHLFLLFSVLPWSSFHLFRHQICFFRLVLLLLSASCTLRAWASVYSLLLALKSYFIDINGELIVSIFSVYVRGRLYLYSNTLVVYHWKLLFLLLLLL